MSILDKYIQFVNEQSSFHRGMAKKYEGKSFRSTLHTTTAEKFEALSVDLESADKTLDSMNTNTSTNRNRIEGNTFRLSLTPDELEGLPPELLEELSLSDADKTEFTIVNLIEEAGGIISLDKLLIALYKKTGEIHKRNSLYSKLSRLASKGLIYYVPGKKGIYSTEQLSSHDVAKLFGISKITEEDLEFSDEVDLLGP